MKDSSDTSEQSNQQSLPQPELKNALNIYLSDNITTIDLEKKAQSVFMQSDMTPPSMPFYELKSPQPQQMVLDEVNPQANGIQPFGIMTTEEVVNSQQLQIGSSRTEKATTSREIVQKDSISYEDSADLAIGEDQSSIMSTQPPQMVPTVNHEQTLISNTTVLKKRALTQNTKSNNPNQHPQLQQSIDLLNLHQTELIQQEEQKSNGGNETPMVYQNMTHIRQQPTVLQFPPQFSQFTSQSLQTEHELNEIKANKNLSAQYVQLQPQQQPQFQPSFVLSNAQKKQSKIMAPTTFNPQERRMGIASNIFKTAVAAESQILIDIATEPAGEEPQPDLSFDELTQTQEPPSALADLIRQHQTSMNLNEIEQQTQTEIIDKNMTFSEQNTFQISRWQNHSPQKKQPSQAHFGIIEDPLDEEEDPRLYSHTIIGNPSILSDQPASEVDNLLSKPQESLGQTEAVYESQEDSKIDEQNDVNLIDLNQQFTSNLVIAVENQASEHGSQNNSPRQEEVKEDEITQIMTGQHRQIQIQQNPLVHQRLGGASSQQSPVQNILDQIRADMANLPVNDQLELSQQQENSLSESEEVPLLQGQQQNLLNYFQQREGASTDQLMSEFMVGFQYLFRSEKGSIKDEREVLTQDKQKFASERKHQYEELKADQQRWQENKEKVEIMYQPPAEIVDLNIGGTHLITTSRQTLTSVPESTLNAMFSGRHALTIHNGRVFIDRDGNAFCQMLSFLRTGKIPMFDSHSQEQAFYDELDFWMIPISPLIGGGGNSQLFLSGMVPVNTEAVGELNQHNQTFDVEWCADTLELTENAMCVRKNGSQHGTVFCSQPMDIFTCYVEFKIQIETIFGGKSHLFIGMVDRSKQRPENLTSTFWKDSPNSIYWDVWTQKIVNIDEKGQQAGTVFGYGCPCEEAISRLGILYDARNRAVSFFKNGINQGVAFTNVVSGMHPSLDLWFQKGEIELTGAKIPSTKKPLKCNI